MLTNFQILEPILWTIFTMVIIWRASDGFETASEYIGRNLTDGVRGATINAIASSIPELLTTIFFLVLLRDAPGFSGGVGTTAGSAIFNGMIIPALVVMVVLFFAISQRIIVSRRVVLRDGIALILCELVLIVFLSSQTLYWWHGLVLMGLYLGYIFFMVRAMRLRQSEAANDAPVVVDDQAEEVTAIENPPETPPSWSRALLTLNLEALIIRGKDLQNRNAWTLLLISTLIMAVACAILVHACQTLGEALGFPIYFVAVIIAAAATSVPDTIISVRDGLRGNYDDAISNALGSNIFDICFALGLPLFLYTAIYSPIEVGSITEVGELRLILLVLTVTALIIYIAGKRMTLLKAFLLLLLYLIFTSYIIGKGFEQEWALQISDGLQNIIAYLERIL